MGSLGRCEVLGNKREGNGGGDTTHDARGAPSEARSHVQGCSELFKAAPSTTAQRPGLVGNLGMASLTVQSPELVGSSAGRPGAGRVPSGDQRGLHKGHAARHMPALYRYGYDLDDTSLSLLVRRVKWLLGVSHCPSSQVGRSFTRQAGSSLASRKTVTGSALIPGNREAQCLLDAQQSLTCSSSSR